MKSPSTDSPLNSPAKDPGSNIRHPLFRSVAMFHFATVLLLVLSVPVPTMAASRVPAQATMLEAIAALEPILEEKVSDEDRRWLISTWSDSDTRRHTELVSWIESIVVAEKRANIGIDPLAFARIRHLVIDQLYCNSLQTDDLVTHRLRRLVAPDTRVLFADCVTGAVVTSFDLGAIAQSNARVADLIGQEIDATHSEEAVREAMRQRFATMDIESQQRLLWGEFRASALSAFLVSANSNARNQLLELAHSTYTRHKDISVTAQVVEKAAMQQLDAVVGIARKDNEILTGPGVNVQIRFLELVTGARLTPFQQLDVTNRIIRQFNKDPALKNQQIAETMNWLDRGYKFGHDPKLGRIRSWTIEEQAQMRRYQAAVIYCRHISAQNKEDRRYLNNLFAHDPVTDADCDNHTFVRVSDLVIAKDGDYDLTRGVLDAHRRVFELIFDFKFTQDEEQWFDEAAISDTNNQRIGLTQAIDGFQQVVADIQKAAPVGPYMNERRRENYAINTYCGNRDDDNTHVVGLIEIINSHDPILFEDCERSVVIRESDVKGRVGTLNFIRALGGHPPLTKKQRKDLIKDIERWFNSKANGALHYKSEKLKFSYWWRKMPITVRRQIAEVARVTTGTVQESSDLRAEFSAKANLQTGLLAMCDYSKNQLKYHTHMTQLQSRSIFNQNSYADSPWVNPEAIDDALDQFATFSPFVKQQCESVWK